MFKFANFDQCWYLRGGGHEQYVFIEPVHAGFNRGYVRHSTLTLVLKVLTGEDVERMR